MMGRKLLERAGKEEGNATARLTVLTTVTAVVCPRSVLRSMRATSLSPSPTTVCSTTSDPLTLGLWEPARGEGEEGGGEGEREEGEKEREREEGEKERERVERERGKKERGERVLKCWMTSIVFACPL